MAYLLRYPDAFQARSVPPPIDALPLAETFAEVQRCHRGGRAPDLCLVEQCEVLVAETEEVLEYWQDEAAGLRAELDDLMEPSELAQAVLDHGRGIFSWEEVLRLAEELAD